MMFLPPKTVRRSQFQSELVPCIKCGVKFRPMWMKTDENICPKCSKEKRK